MKRWISFLAALSAAIAVSGCSGSIDGADESNFFVAQVTEANANETGHGQRDHEESAEAVYSLEDIPEYSGKAYIEINGGQPGFSESDKQLTEAFELYSDLDELGRCGEAYANICPELMPTEERSGIGQIKPSGWHTVKYNSLIEGNYLYNRCHLIGYQLAGENANEKNLITGTRYLNVEGMLPFEDLVDDYVDSTGNHVLYRVTPIFDGTNLVASGVEMEAWSVEDDGVGICFHVYCYNVQPGIEINYADGESWESEEYSIQQEETAGAAETAGTEKAAGATETAGTEKAAGATETAGTEKAAEATEAEGTAEMAGATEAADAGREIRDYVLNKNTMRIHLPTCASAKDVAEANRKEYTGAIGDLIAEGYLPCGRCLAEYRD